MDDGAVGVGAVAERDGLGLAHGAEFGFGGEEVEWWADELAWEG